jgi:hypothetical protein
MYGLNYMYISITAIYPRIDAGYQKLPKLSDCGWPAWHGLAVSESGSEAVHTNYTFSMNFISFL